MTTRRAQPIVALALLLFASCATGARETPTARPPKSPDNIDGLQVAAFVQSDSGKRCVELAGRLVGDAETLCMLPARQPEVVASFPADDARDEYVYVYSLPLGTALANYRINGQAVEPTLVQDHISVFLMPPVQFSDEIDFEVRSETDVAARCTQEGLRVSCRG